MFYSSAQTGFKSWTVLSLLSASIAFCAVRLLVADFSGVKSSGLINGSSDGALRSTAGLARAYEDAMNGGDALSQRLRVLTLIERAHPDELRRLFLCDALSWRDKRVVARRWAEVEPKSFFQLLKSLSRTEWERSADQWYEASTILFRSWATYNPNEAVEAILPYKGHPHFRGALWGIAQTVLTKDPQRGFAIAALMPRGTTDAINIPNSAWKENPSLFLASAAGASAQWTQHPQLLEAVTSAFGEWLNASTTEAARWLSEMPQSLQEKLWPEMIRQFAAKDLSAAQAWFLEQPPSAQRERAGARIVEAWARHDPRGALDWLQEHLHGGQAEAYRALSWVMTQQSVASGQQLIEAMDPGKNRDEAVAALANQWSLSDAKNAAQWLLHHLPENDPGRNQALNVISARWAEQDLAAAAQYAKERADFFESDMVLQQVARRFARANELEDGLIWAAALPDRVRGRQWYEMYITSNRTDSLPSFFKALEQFPGIQQQEMVEVIARKTAADRYKSVAESVSLWPESFREMALQSVKSDR